MLNMNLLSLLLKHSVMSVSLLLLSISHYMKQNVSSINLIKDSNQFEGLTKISDFFKGLTISKCKFTQHRDDRLIISVALHSSSTSVQVASICLEIVPYLQSRRERVRVVEGH